MKKKSSKPAEKSKATVKMRDLKPGQNPKGGARSKTADKAADAMTAYIKG
ncbi:MAG: hypothetical protein ABI718_16005 [Acidobacteriota bacterium]